MARSSAEEGSGINHRKTPSITLTLQNASLEFAALVVPLQHVEEAARGLFFATGNPQVGLQSLEQPKGAQEAGKEAPKEQGDTRDLRLECQ
jgi:hypothetical protein